MVALAMETRQRVAIDNFHNTAQPIHGDELQAAAYRGRYPGATHRPTAVCFTYNCHGLTFASRRTEITSPAEIRKILVEDAYEMVQINDVLPGDIVIYISNDNDIEHSGIVVDVPRFVGQILPNPKILSKWGSAHEVIHMVRDCPYNASRVEYYRVTK
jgi:hypothetical protein